MTDFADRAASYFIPPSIIEKIIPAYCYREEQAVLSRGIASAFANQEFLVAEAGTGIGKTLAYLIPAVMWAAEEGQQVVVSTRTKALQQQIVEKDLPDVKRLLGNNFTWAAAKGRDNYLCWNRYMQILAGKVELEQEEVEFIESILSWAEKTKTGDRKELPLNNRLGKHWQLVAANRNNCRMEVCPYQDKCFRLKMLNRLKKADIIVVNHALLLSDIAVDNSILPEYKYLIVDEAHNFEREAFSRLSVRFSFNDLIELLKILSSTSVGSRSGYLQHLKRSYLNFTGDINVIEQLVGKAQELTSAFQDAFSSALPSSNEDSSSRLLNERDKQSKWFERVIDSYMEWLEQIKLLIYKVEQIKPELSEEDAAELQNIAAQLFDFADSAFISMEENINREDCIAWLEVKHGKPDILVTSPVQIGKIVHQRLFEKLESAVMISATLSVDDKFDYFINRNGLDMIQEQGRLNTILEKSPFNYEEQACLYVVHDMYWPDSSEFNQDLIKTLSEIFAACNGRVLVLFTSRKQMLAAAKNLEPICRQLELRLIVQDVDGDASYAVNEYINTERAVLMGLDSFWEGIDLRGDLLRCVVIVKLPFRSPSEPFCSAGDRYCQMNRLNSFSHFMLPDAVVRLKQGVGRLIRSEEDYGLVVILDSRFSQKAYGQVFQRSIPITKIDRVNQRELGGRISNWLNITKTP